MNEMIVESDERAEKRGDKNKYTCISHEVVECTLNTVCLLVFRSGVFLLPMLFRAGAVRCIFSTNVCIAATANTTK